MTESKEKLVEIGSETVVIDKLFGPTAACRVRVRHDGDDWIVERQRWTCPNGLTSKWEEVCRFDLQESLWGAFPDFDHDDPTAECPEDCPCKAEEDEPS